jgi:hypothetical protein
VRFIGGKIFRFLLTAQNLEEKTPALKNVGDGPRKIGGRSHRLHTMTDFQSIARLPDLTFDDPAMAEGVVSEPFLPSGDQGCKGGFATLSKPAVTPSFH